MLNFSGHVSALEKAIKDGVLKRGQEADITVLHRCTSIVHFKPFCDCSPRVLIKTKETGLDEPTVVHVKHVLSDGSERTTEKDGINTIARYYN